MVWSKAQEKFLTYECQREKLLAFQTATLHMWKTEWTGYEPITYQKGPSSDRVKVLTSQVSHPSCEHTELGNLTRFSPTSCHLAPLLHKLKQFTMIKSYISTSFSLTCDVWFVFDNNIFVFEENIHDLAFMTYRIWFTSIIYKKLSGFFTVRHLRFQRLIFFKLCEPFHNEMNMISIGWKTTFVACIDTRLYIIIIYTSSI